MHTEQKWEKLVSNRTDSSVSVDERQIQESRGGWQRSLPLPDLFRKIEGPLLAGYLQAGYVAMSDGNLSDTSHVAYYICQHFGEKYQQLRMPNAHVSATIATGNIYIT